MRSLLQPTRSLAQRRASSKTQNLLFSCSHATRLPRQCTPRTRAVSRTDKRTSSSATPIVSTPPHRTELINTTIGSSPPEDPAPDPGDEDDGTGKSEAEKNKRTRKTKAEDADSERSLPLPEGLDILWTPNTMKEPSPSALPPPEIFQEVMTDLLITLHPQTQHRAVYPSLSNPPVEPTLGLYCPIEGGDYIIDQTVQELARRTDSDVVVLDAVQLAAGEWGAFGKAASILHLPHNPLHFRSPDPPRGTTHNRSRAEEEEEDEDDDDDFMSGFMPPHMTVHLVQQNSGRGGRQSVLTPMPRGSTSAKAKAFFDELVNISSPYDEEGSQGKRRSRLIYIRDYPTLAPTASSWYPSLLASVKERRQGPNAKPSSPAANPMTIIFGMTPPIIQPSSSPSRGGQSLLGLMNSRRTAVVGPNTKSNRKGYGEDESSDKNRERRLRERVRRWERDEQAFYDDMPRLPQSFDNNNANEQTGMIVPFQQVFANAGGLPVPSQSRSGGRPEDSHESTHFFRTSVLVPSLRNHARERICRVLRRREINELTIRMAVGAIGGRLEDGPPLLSLPPDDVETSQSEALQTEKPQVESTVEVRPSDVHKLWEDWGKRVETWSDVKDIADRALGYIVATDISTIKSSLDPTHIPWQAVITAWAAKSSLREIRKSWLQESSGKTLKEDTDDELAETAKLSQDEVIQRVKDDPELSPHEQRLLGCIVDAASMNTSFSSVHLPPHTIDSVRTIASLPLLHPAAFQQGILKQHSMTGCLLFGPPGTGKTLVVRALAKEAGCRMLAVQPSDVMDMYVGEGEKLVRSVFSLARRLSPCVVFLDEIDALFGARTSARETGGAMAHHGVITEFMQEMDGLKTRSNSNVIVIGATNRPFDLDDAVLRRLPRRLLVDLPGEKEREEILKILLRDEKLADDVDLGWLSRRTDLFSGSDLKHLCVSAALDAVKEGVTLPWTVPRVDISEHPADASAAPKSTEGVEDAALSTQEREKEEGDASQDSVVNSDSSEAVHLSSEKELPPRILYLRHFTKALKEITPSSSESLGSLSALRKWNEEFGEGQKKKQKVMWGKGLFGFSESGTEQPRAQSGS